MSKMAKLSRLYRAVRPIPPQRHFWRIIRRSQRKWYAVLPGYTFKSLVARTRKLECRPQVEALRELATLRQQHERYSASLWAPDGENGIVLDLHGQSRSIDTGSPCDAVSPVVSYLWQMSSSYMGYLLDSDDESRAVQYDRFVDLANGFCQASAWHKPGVFSRQWHPYAASHRLMNLVCGRVVFDQQLSGSQMDDLDTAIRIHTGFVSANLEYDIHFNHLAKNLLSLLISSAYRTGQVPPSLMDEYCRVMDYQLLPDGGHAELCPMYHLQMLADIQLLTKLPIAMIAGEARDWLDSTVERMQSAAAIMSFEDGDVSLFGDSWLGECPSARDLGVEAADAKPVTDGTAISRLIDTGYTKIQSKQLELILDNGHAGAPENPGHAHDDYLSIEIAVAGQRWVVDYGVESYEAGQARNNSRSAQKHNGPTYDGAKGLDGWGSFRIGARRGAPVVARRQLPNGWEVIDTFHKPLGEKGILLARSIAVNCETGLAIYDRWTGVAESRHPRSTFLLTRDADFLTEQGLQLQVVQGSWKKQGDARAHQVIGMPFDVTEWVLEPESDAAMLLITDQSEDPVSLSTFLLQAITQ